MGPLTSLARSSALSRLLPLGPRRRLGLGLCLGLCLLLMAGCTDQEPDEAPDHDQTRSAALRVSTVAGAEELDDLTISTVEDEVGDLLSRYAVGAWLGDFPREDFVRSFESFTSEAARSAAGDIELLTAASVSDAERVRATELGARLSLLAEGGAVLGATAVLHFELEATMPDGSTRPLVLDGRLMLEDAEAGWAVFGYDVTLDDGAAADGQAAS